MTPPAPEVHGAGNPGRLLRRGQSQGRQGTWEGGDRDKAGIWEGGDRDNADKVRGKEGEGDTESRQARYKREEKHARYIWEVKHLGTDFDFLILTCQYRWSWVYYKVKA